MWREGERERGRARDERGRKGRGNGDGGSGGGGGGGSLSCTFSTLTYDLRFLFTMIRKTKEGRISGEPLLGCAPV